MICNEQRRGPVINVARARDLLDDAVVHHGDHISHRHGLELAMRDIDRGCSEPVVQRAQFMDHRLAHFGIECAERLVHQETFRLAHDRPPKRDTLPVAAGKTRHGTVEKMRKCAKIRATSTTRRSASAAPMPSHFKGKPIFRRTFMCG